MVINVKDLPQPYSTCEWHYDNGALKEMLRIKGTKIADGYGCTLIGRRHFLYEKKSKTHLSKGIIQLQTTTEKLIDLKKPIDDVLLICDKIGRHERSLYERRKIKGEYYLWDKGVDKPVEIQCNNKTYLVRLIYRREIKC